MTADREQQLIELILLIAERLYICSQLLARNAERGEQVMKWTKQTENADSLYIEDRRTRYISGPYEITKEGDGMFWLRFNGNPLGMGPLLHYAKLDAKEHQGREAAKEKTP